MNVRFLSLANAEVDEAVAWYDEKAEDKGRDFLDELDRVVRLVKAYPLAPPEIEPEIRRCLFARFPYSWFTALTIKRLLSSQSPILIANPATGSIA